MNKRIVSALVLAGMIATTSSAFASRARNSVMGQGGAGLISGQGSFYYEDAYNMFYNPAYVNDFKNWVIVEKGSADDVAGNKASFGFVTSMMNFNMGLFFNRAGGTINPNVSQPIDLFFGGDTGVKWGLNVQYAESSAASAFEKSSELNARAGISINGLDPYVSFRIIGKDKLGGTDVQKHKGMGAGLRYHFGEWTPYVAYENRKTEDEPVTIEDKDNIFIVGLGRETKLAEGARLVYALYYASTSNTVTAGGVETKTSSNVLPIEMAVEADALSWLTLRGGVTRSIIASSKGRTTTARIGGTFHVSKVDLDYAFGNGSATASSTLDSPAVGFDSETFHQVAMRYSW